MNTAARLKLNIGKTAVHTTPTIVLETNLAVPLTVPNRQIIRPESINGQPPARAIIISPIGVRL
jgi:hypothetical protein